MPRVTRLSTLIGLIAVVALAAGCAGSPTADLAMAAHADMPADVREAPNAVSEAYRFAVANPDIVSEIPCYCGCGAMGHSSNYSCYAEGTAATGDLVYDYHALGCGICVDITQDTMRMVRQGKSIVEVQDYVDEAYSKFGEPTVSGAD